MPVHLRALVVILVIATAMFLLAKTPITARACSKEDFVRRRNVWFGLTLSMFLAHNFWLFIAASSFVLLYAMRTETNRFALYLSAFLTMPHLSAQLPALGVVDHLFVVSQLRMLALVILLPTFLALRKSPDVEPFGRLLADKLLLCILALQFALTVSHTTVTNLLRENVFYPFVDVFLIYYVASRSLKTVEMFRDALAAFVVGAMVYCAVIAFEHFNHWLLYRALDDALGATSHAGRTYLVRAGQLRAEGTGGQAIVSGFTCAIAIGIYLYVGTNIKSIAWRGLIALVLVGGLYCAFSRGPWVGATLMFLVFLILGPSPVSNLLKVTGIGLVVAPFIFMTEAGSKLIDVLPWVGTVDARSVTERNTLVTVTLQVINQHPIFGRFEFRTDPGLEQLRGGDGLIDLVNTYMIIALRGGYTSLGLFVGTAAVVAFGVLRALYRVGDKKDERHALGCALLVTLTGILFMIGAVSPILSVYPLYWCVVGLSVGFSRLVARGNHSKGPAAARQSGSGMWASAVK